MPGPAPTQSWSPVVTIIGRRLPFAQPIIGFQATLTCHSRDACHNFVTLHALAWNPEEGWKRAVIQCLQKPLCRFHGEY